jgi:glutamyl-tRNA synthetase
MGQIGPGLRAALTGGAPAPDLGQTLELLGREEALARLKDQSGLQDQTGLKDQTG